MTSKMFQKMVVKSCDELTIGTGASKLAKQHSSSLLMGRNFQVHLHEEENLQYQIL